MVFPTDPVPVVVEIAPGANPAASPGTWSWTDITSQVRLADRISIVTGRQNEASQIDPSRCTLRLDNTSGDFTPRNPYGQWYGQIGRNTPLRVRIRRGQDGFGRTVSNGWGTADSGQAWIVATAAASDYSVSGGVARHAHTNVNILRRTVLDTSLLDVEQVVDVATPVLLTGAALVTGLVARHDNSGPTYYWLRCEFNAGGTSVTLKLTKVVAGTFTDLAVLDPVPGLAYAAGVPLRVRAQVLGNRLAIKVWPASGTEPSGWHLEATDDSITTAGQTGVQSWLVSGNTNTLPVTPTFDNYTAHVDRFNGFVSSWPPRWDPSERDQTVPIQADGVLRRLGRASPAARSALRRTIPDSGALAYWPMEDGDDASQAASGLPGQQPLTISGQPSFAPIESWTSSRGYTVTYGTRALADLSTGASFAAPVPSAVTTATASAWTVAIAADIDSGSPPLSGDLVLLEVATTGSFVRWQLVIVASTSHTKLIAYDATGSPTTVFDDPGVNSGMILHNIAVWQNGSNISAGYIRWSRSGSGYFVTGSTAGTLGGVTAVRVNPTQTTATIPMPAGHLAVWTGRDLDAVDLDDGAVNLALYSYGWTGLGGSAQPTGEAATARLTRLCAEDGVQLAMPTVSEDATTLMGRQPIATPLDLYRECETADQGVLHELGFGLGYVPRAARYNRSATLTLDYAAGQVAPPLEPVDDDQLLSNRVTVRRVDGSSATAEDSASIASAGPYESSVDVSMANDTTLLDHASWRVHVGSTQVMRWPQISVNLARSPELVDDVLSTRVQSRIGVVNPPAQAVGDDIDVIVEGYSETIGHKDWLVSYTTSPAQPWDVATVDGEQRVAADGSTLAASISDTDTVIALSNTAANGAWTTDPADYPLDVRVGGEQVRADAPGAVLTTNPWLLADGAGWTALAATISRVTDVVRPGTPYGSLRVVAAGGTSGGVNATSRVTVSPNGRYVATIWAYASSPVTVGPAVDWHDAGGAYLTTSIPTPVTIAAGLWTPVSAVVTAHASAASAAMRARHDPATPAGAVYYVTALTLASEQTVIGVGAFQRLSSAAGRGVNGVQRAWPAGTEVDVWQPAIAAL